MTIFIKSYPKDFRFLKYCLMSIKKNVTGQKGIVLVLPIGIHFPEWLSKMVHELSISVHYVNEYGNGYIYQQLVKLQAWKYTIDDKIMFVDSDCVFHKPIDISTVGIWNIVYKAYDSWSPIELHDFRIWQKPTERAIKTSCPNEFMQRIPFIIYRDTLCNLNRWMEKEHGMTLEQYVMTQKSFSEFNLMGAYIWEFEKDRYKFINKDTEDIGDEIFTSLWSWADQYQAQTCPHIPTREFHIREHKRAVETINKIFNLNLTDI